MLQLEVQVLVNRLLLLVLTVVVQLPAAMAAQEPLKLWNRNFDTAPVNKVLELALSKTTDLYPPQSVLPTASMEQAEALQQLREASADIDVLSAGSSSEIDSEFLVVPFPVLKGLLGYRICLIRKGDQSRFDGVETAFDFQQQQLRVCQGAAWPDTTVLRRNGIAVVTSDRYQSLFTLLENKQCDCFLRGAQEIVAEYQLHHQQFDIEKSFLLHYFQPGFFYFNVNRKALAGRIELGLLRALDDGSYQALFDSLLADSLQQLDIEQRRVIRLNSPKASAVNKSLQGINRLWLPM
jgi:hypothetical protein